MKNIITILLLMFVSKTLSAQSPQPRWVRTGHLGGVISLIFSPDSKHFISSATKDQRILVWNAASGIYERTIVIPGSPLKTGPYDYADYRFSTALSSDGSTIASIGAAGIYLIDFKTGIPTDSLIPYTTNIVLCLQFSESGDTIAWIGQGYYGFNFCRFKRSTRQLIDSSQFGSPNRFSLYQGPQIAISADTKKLAYVYSHDTTAVVDFDSGQTSNHFYTPGAEALALNSNGSQLAVGGWPSELVNTLTGHVEFAWPDSTSPRVLNYLDRSDTLIYFGKSGFWLHLPDKPKDEFTKVTSHGADGWGSEYGISQIALSPDRSMLLTATDLLTLWGASIGGSISIYRKPDFLEKEITGDCGTITGIHWSPVKNTITLSDYGGAIRSYDVDSDVPAIEYGPLGYRIGGFAYFADGDSLAASFFGTDDVEFGDEDKVSTLSANALKSLDGIITHLNLGGVSLYYLGLLLSPDGKQLVLQNNFARSLGSWSAVQLGPENAFTFSPDGTVLLIGDSTHLAAMSTSTLKVTDLSDPNHSTILGASFAPNGNEIAVMQGDRSVEILNYPACTETYRLQEHTGTITGAMFSQNSRYLITSSNDSTMKVWDLLTGQPIYTYSYSSPLVTAGFSHDSKYVAASDGNASVIVWDTPPFMKVEAQQEYQAGTLLQNMPNPVTSETRIGYTIPYSEEVTIELLDVMGREIVRLPQGRMPAGENVAVLSEQVVRSLPSGVYYYRLEAKSGTMTKRMVVE